MPLKLDWFNQSSHRLVSMVLLFLNFLEIDSLNAAGRRDDDSAHSSRSHCPLSKTSAKFWVTEAAHKSLLKSASNGISFLRA
jgi:hypothetical protein